VEINIWRKNRQKKILHMSNKKCSILNTNLSI
jgi:hypothetical protein